MTSPATLIGIARREKPFADMETLRAGTISVDTGLGGDFRGQSPDRKVTVMAREDWAAACRDLGQELPWTTRRANLLVEGIDLPQQIGARVRVGEALLEVFEECDPCGRMEAQVEGLRAALTPDWRGGLACGVLRGGRIEIGEEVAACPGPAAGPLTVLDFWFDEAGPDTWFGGGPAFDDLVRVRLGQMSARAPAEHMDWAQSPLSALALVVLLDQVPRQINRGSAAAFATDTLARSVSETMIARGDLRFFDRSERVMSLMPLEHAEDLAAQDRCVALIEDYVAEGPDDGYLAHAKAHRELIRRFGRFPHRNAALGRTSTPEEAGFLEGGGYAPG